MKVAAIIVNYKTPDMTLEAAQAAIKALNLIDGDWELIIVDNDSQDGSFEKICGRVKELAASSKDRWDRVKVRNSGRNGGFGAGNNYGIQQFKDKPAPDYFYVLNSDAFPELESVGLLVDFLDSNSEVGIAGSYIHGPDGDPHVTAFRFPSVFSEFEGSIRLGIITKMLQKYVVPMGIPSQTTQVDWLAGASMMVRNQVLEDIGLFDENFFLYFEETDLCLRAKKAGWATVYVRESSVSHIGSASTGMKTWKRIPGFWLNSRRHYFAKNYGLFYFYLATIARIAGEVLWNIKIRLLREPSNKPTGLVFDLVRHLVTPYRYRKF